MTSVQASNSPQAEERSFEVDGLLIAAKCWNSGATHKAIAMHGWLDNCTSFDLIALALKDIELVAIDSLGHGKSDFRSADSEYLIWAEVSELFSVADQLGWETFNLIGHSRGAGISSLCAGTFPNRIERLVLIEGGIPLPMEAAEAPENLAAHITVTQKLAGTKGTQFNTWDEAIAARADGFTKVSTSAAEILATRSLLPDGQSFRWHADARLKAPSSMKLTHDEVDAFLNRITAPTLLIEATEGIIRKMPFAERHIAHIAPLTRAVLPGGHHLHMEEAAAECGALIEDFLTKI